MLVSWEQSACKVPQIVPGYSAPVELYEGRGILLNPAGYAVYQEVFTEGAYFSITEIAGALYAYYTNEELRHKHANAMYEYVTRPEFNWTNIAKRWDKEVLDG
jgi:glycosyltransferase involved in cell wall biosynthesis